MRKWVIILLFIIVIILALIFNNNKDYIRTDKLYINEVMSKNSSTVMDDYSEYSDYIELYNGYDYDINLEGYHLSDREFDVDKWKFPSVTIKKKSYLIVYASGKNKCDIEKSICHTNFKLSSLGEDLTLTDPTGNIISHIEFGEMEDDISYSYNGKEYVYTSVPTPNKENVIKDAKPKNLVKENKLIINEYMTHNKTVGYLSDGGYYDFIELYNPSDKEVNMNGLYLSDNKNKLTKFALPDKVVKPKEYVVVYLTGDTKVDGVISANFGLSDDDIAIYLSNGETIFEELPLQILKDNVSYGLKDDKWYYFITPTPGKVNNTKAYEKMP